MVPWMRVSRQPVDVRHQPVIGTMARIGVQHVDAGGGASRHADQSRGRAGELPEFADTIGIGAGILEAIAALGFGDAGSLLRSARKHRQPGRGQGQRAIKQVFRLIVVVGAGPWWAARRLPECGPLGGPPAPAAARRA